MSIVQISSFQGTEALITDPHRLVGACEVMAKAKGFLAAYHGFEVEDKRIHHMACLWQSAEDHKNFRSSPECKEFDSRLKAVQAGPEDTVQVMFVGDPEKPFRCLTTEVVIGRPRPGKNVEDLIEATQGVFSALKGAPGYYPSPTYGEVVGRPATYYIVLGWHTPEDHKNAVTGGGQGKDAVAKFTDIVGHSIVHVHFDKCQI